MVHQDILFSTANCNAAFRSHMCVNVRRFVWSEVIQNLESGCYKSSGLKTAQDFSNNHMCGLKVELELSGRNNNSENSSPIGSKCLHFEKSKKMNVHSKCHLCKA